MTSACRSSLFRLHRRSSVRGFTLVEIGMATLIIGVLAALGVPSLKRTLIATRASAVASDLRTFAGTFQHYEQQNGSFPPAAGIGVMPPVLQGALSQSAWERVTPIGGRYSWESNSLEAGVRYRAGISIRSLLPSRVTADRELLLALDRLIDDGNLATGNFFLGAGNEPYLVIER